MSINDEFLENVDIADRFWGANNWKNFSIWLVSRVCDNNLEDDAFENLVKEFRESQLGIKER